MVLSEKQLNDYANEIYQTNFGQQFDGKVIWSKRMKNVAGNCRTDGRTALNYYYYERYGSEDILQVLRHELVHKYLFDTIGLHTHSTPEFVRLLNEVNGSQIGKPMPVSGYVYSCPCCSREWTFRKKIRNKKLSCEDCGDGSYSADYKIQFVREITVEPTNEPNVCPQ